MGSEGLKYRMREKMKNVQGKILLKKNTRNSQLISKLFLYFNSKSSIKGFIL
jgi:hypothetical protein